MLYRAKYARPGKFTVRPISQICGKTYWKIGIAPSAPVEVLAGKTEGFNKIPMPIIIQSRTLRWLRLTAEGRDVAEITRSENVSKKEVEKELEWLYRQLNASNPLEALQKLVKRQFKVVD
ncbi:MAG: hypothetical protein KatS3mg032_1024 [Cyclobacteriaceae bacterium]|nr:MAG: hypothetical protein KatS3mg032_1024 [Cyclobacteriaceae bacterium]